MKKIILTSLLCGVMAGCSNVGWTPNVGQRQLVAEPDKVDLMLADAADRSTRALETLAAMEQSQMPIKPVAAVPQVPQDLARGVSVQWSGPAEPLVQELARKAGYAYNAVGSKPATDIIVSVAAQNKPLIELFRDIGMQMGARGDLKVNMQMRSIEIHYAEMANRAEY